ncbi:MAG: hypothetical protein M3069_11505, partial [Chloroflexota bacterium]|nr:hypothetical protein [Chloroflexota bacterium]
IVMGTTETAGPSVILYNGSQLPILEAQGSANGGAVFAVNGHFGTLDDKGNETWRAPSAGTP